MWWYIVVFIVALVVSYSMMPKPENAKPEGLGDVTVTFELMPATK